MNSKKHQNATDEVVQSERVEVRKREVLARDS